MRTLSITLRSSDGRLTAEETFQSCEDAYEFIANGGISVLSLRLDVLERDGPWKPEGPEQFNCPFEAALGRLPEAL